MDDTKVQVIADIASIAIITAGFGLYWISSKKKKADKMENERLDKIEETIQWMLKDDMELQKNQKNQSNKD